MVLVQLYLNYVASHTFEVVRLIIPVNQQVTSDTFTFSASS